MEHWRLWGGNAYTVLSSRGELGHAVNENPRSWCGVVGDSRLNVNVEDAELDCELAEDSLKQLKERWVNSRRIGNLVVGERTQCPDQASLVSSDKS